MKNKLMLTGIFVLSFCMIVLSQTSYERAEQLAAEFSKIKHKEKEKDGVKTITTIHIETKPDFRDDISGYAGKYEMKGCRIIHLGLHGSTRFPVSHP